MADLSPEIAAQLQALESSYGENPGRYFVPYAGLLREARQPERAEEILRENLKRFPGLSAHVLLGRCLADRGAYQEASNEFHYVLSIDAQNLIALRTLAEMSAASGRTAEARRWYDELLAVDPMNGDARAAVARLGTGDADAATADQPASADTGWGGADEPAAAAVSAAADEDDEETDAGWGNLELDSAPAPETRDEAPAPEFDAFGFGEVELGGEADEPADARMDVGEETAAAGSGDDEFGLLDFGEEAEEEEEEAAATMPAEDVSGEPEVVTETMAELYASQGLREQAAEVYRELIQRRGEEPALARRLAELEAVEEDGVEQEEPAQDEAPDWLLRVDAAVDGADEHDRLPDLGLDTSLGELELEEPASADAPPEPAAGTTGDPFAESVSAGFAEQDEGAEPGTAERAAWAPPEVEETGAEAAGGFDLVVIDEAVELDGDAHPPESPEEAAELSADWAVAAAPLEEDEEEEAPAPAPSAEAAEPAPAGTRRTMRDYFAALLSWAPAAEAAPAEEEAPPPAPAPEEHAPYEPAGAAAPGPDEEPEEPLPWELPADAPAHDDAAPSGPEQGFSFEEFFAGGAGPEPEPTPPEPASGAEAAPATPEPAPASGGTEGAGGQPAAGEGDEDLESFQAWLQSLKR